MGTAQEAIQARVAAKEAVAAIEYGRRTLDWMGGRAWGISAEYGAAEWAVEQWATAQATAAELGVEIRSESAAHGLKRAKGRAAMWLQAADAAVKAFGGVRQLRLAVAACDEAEVA